MKLVLKKSEIPAHLLQFFRPAGWKPKDLINIPAMVAEALRADGWWLRQDIIWSKPNPMPESITDRCTKAHEYLFLLSKNERYFYDAEAIKEPATGGLPGNVNEPKAAKAYLNGDNHHRTKAGLRAYSFKRRTATTPPPGTPRQHREDREEKFYDETRNKRSVWDVPTSPFPEAHFATYPPALIKPCILAGCPPAGRRCDCNAVIETPTGEGAIDDPTMTTGRAGMNRPRRADEGTRPITRREQRWEARQMKESPHRDRMRVICGAAFDHYIRTDDSGARPLPEGVRVDFRARGWITDAPPCEHPIEPAGVVLDPFFGAGTTGLVALQLGRSCIGIELNPEYVELARKRLDGVMPLFAQVDVRPSYDNSGKGRSGSRDYSQPCLIETLDKDGCDE